MERLEFILEIKKNKNITLEDIVNILIEKKIPKYEAFVLIRNNFNYEQIRIMYYIDLLYNDDGSNPFNEDFINYSEDG